MIEQNEIFNEVQDNLGLWCADSCSGADLAAATGVAITNKLRAVSVLPDAVPELWPWLEDTNIKIITRFVVDGGIDDSFMSGFVPRISAAFRDGADGAIVFIKFRDLSRFASELMYVRDDLFFNKTLSIGLDINEIEHTDWDVVFKIMQSLQADSLTITLSYDDGDKSDFVGRVYAMLNANMGEWHGALQFVLGEDIARIDQVYRLIQQLRFNMVPNLLFWINNE